MSHIPIRTCVACRRPAERTALIRLVIADGDVIVDPDASSRGAYLCTRPECLRAALRRRGALLVRALGRSAGARQSVQNVRVDEERLAAQWLVARESRPAGAPGRAIWE